MSTIECQMVVGPRRELSARVTTEVDKLSKLRPGQQVNVRISDQETGPMTLLNLWKMWMRSVAAFMAANGSVMPLMIKKDGSWYGQRAFNEGDANELFTVKYLGVDAEGMRLSWSKSGRDGMRPATKTERFIALQRLEAWATDKGIVLSKPRRSEYFAMEEEQHV